SVAPVRRLAPVVEPAEEDQHQREDEEGAQEAPRVDRPGEDQEAHEGRDPDPEDRQRQPDPEAEPEPGSLGCRAHGSAPPPWQGTSIGTTGGWQQPPARRSLASGERATRAGARSSATTGRDALP